MALCYRCHSLFYSIYLYSMEVLRKLLNSWPYLLAAIAIVLLILKIKSCNDSKISYSDVTLVIESKSEPAIIYVDESGHTHAKKEIAETDIRTVKIAYQKEIDSLTALIKIKEGEIKYYVGLSTSTSGKVVPVIVKDSSGCVTDFSYSDKWSSIKGSIVPTPVIEYNFRDSLVITGYKKGGGLFKRSQNFIDAFSVVPNVKVNNLTGFNIGTKDPGRIGVGPYVGYGWNGTWNWSAGVSLHYSLIRF